MADDRWLSWQSEYAGTNRLPSAGGALVLFAIVALVLLALLAGPEATADSGGQSFCDIHQGKPAWDSVCAEARKH